MRRIALAIVGMLLASLTAPATDPPRDTLAAAFTRAKRLKGRVTVEFRDVELAEAVKAISVQLEEQKLGALRARFGPGASKLSKVTYAAKDKSVEEVLDGLLGSLKLGYVVISRPGEFDDGWLFLDAGTERGYPAGVTPPKKPASPEDEEAAAEKLELARKLLADGKADRAETILRFVVKQYPATRAGAAAKGLLEKKAP